MVAAHYIIYNASIQNVKNKIIMEQSKIIKEKALALINSFYFMLPNNGSQMGINSTTSRYEEGKKCAIRSIEFSLEIIGDIAITPAIMEKIDMLHAIRNEISTSNPIPDC